MNSEQEKGTLREDILFLLGRVAWRLAQAALATAGVIALFVLVSPRGGDTKEKAYIATMKSDLRNLVTAQEAYFADHTKYAASLDEMGRNYMTSTGVSVVIGQAIATGWFATATHNGTKYRCVIFVGNLPPPRKGAVPGAPVCWKP